MAIVQIEVSRCRRVACGPMLTTSRTSLIRRGLLLGALSSLFLLAGCSGGTDSSDPFIAGRSVYGDVCSACHGNAGQGGVGPSLSTVDEVFPMCRDQIKWITLGSDGWKETVGDTYGAMDAPVEGGMPAMADQLTAEEIAQVAAFERTQFGDSPREVSQADCGVLPPSDDQ